MHFGNQGMRVYLLKVRKYNTRILRTETIFSLTTFSHDLIVQKSIFHTSGNSGIRNLLFSTPALQLLGEESKQSPGIYSVERILWKNRRHLVKTETS